MEINGAGLLILNNRGQILAVHRKKDVVRANKWGLPGGVVKPGEDSRQVARAKAEQETGIDFKSKDLSYFGKFRFRDGDDLVMFTVWAVRFHGEEDEVKLNPEGHDECMWISPEKLFGRDDLMTGMYLILDRFLSRQ